MSLYDSGTCDALSAKSPLAVLCGLATLLTAAYAAIGVFSFRFAPETETVQRPVLAVLGLLASAFGCYFVAISVAVRVRNGKPLLAVILVSSVVFRAVSLYSWPILEIDVYRYLWDGAVTLEGISPYRYSPEQVLLTMPDEALPDDLHRLVELRDGNATLETIVSRVHYSELPTIYPPVSQAVFAAAVSLTPERAGVLERIVTMKSAFVVFDLATLGVVIALLRLAGMHYGWSVAYGWCPLVIKEITNTGHLDSLAVFLATLALFFVLKSLASNSCLRSRRMHSLAATLLLALAIGAKLYPLVLVPLFVTVLIRSHGWRWASANVAVLLLVTVIVAWPMLSNKISAPPSGTSSTVTDGDKVGLPIPVETTPTKPQNPSAGLTAFLQRWEMNDFLFMLIVENLKPSTVGTPEQRPWFSVVPNAWRAGIVSLPSRWLAVTPRRAAFLVTRAITILLFMFISLLLILQARRSIDSAVWLKAAFLTLAWFWLLSPTQNPWYWIWAVPLATFGQSRAWLALSGLAMIYYVRFWLLYHWGDQPVLGTSYAGVTFFDFVVTWLEFGPWFLWLGVETVCATCRRRRLLLEDERHV